MNVADELYARLGRALKEARKDARLTQAAVGRAMKLSRVAIANIEAGRHQITVHQLLAYSQAVGASACELLRTAEPDVPGDLRRRAKAQNWSEEVQALMALVMTRADKREPQ